MCLTSTKYYHDEFLKDSKNSFEVWKCILITKFGNLRAPFQDRYYYKQGWNYANGKSRHHLIEIITEYNQYWPERIISDGIHCLKTVYDAKAMVDRQYDCNKTYIVVKFTAYKKDIIGVGEKDLALRKAFLTKREYNKIMWQVKKLGLSNGKV